MSTKALYIRHKALPGKRDDVKRIWEKYARAYIDNAAGHVVYIYSFDDSDPDVVVAYQAHNGADAAEDFASQPGIRITNGKRQNSSPNRRNFARSRHNG